MSLIHEPDPTFDEPDPGEVEAFADRMFGDLLGAMNVFAVTLGVRLGWYDALATADDLSSVDLAARTDSDERYAREWLEQQTVNGVLTVADAALSPSERRYRLSSAHAAVLADEDSLAFMAPFATSIATFGSNIDDLVAVYRTGAGFGWHQHGDGARCGQGAGNRPMFLHQLAQDYLSQIPEAVRALEPGGRVADVGCGLGWSSIGIALACPGIEVDGFDIDEPSIEMARRHALEAGVSDRVRFHTVDVGTLEPGRYDLVLALECIHDMPDPVAVLTAMRAMAGADGVVVVMDEKAGEHFTGEPDPLEQLLYGFSIICCLPDGRDADESVATGTVMRPAVLDGYARGAGFAAAEPLDLEHDTFRFYRLAD